MIVDCGYVIFALLVTKSKRNKPTEGGWRVSLPLGEELDGKVKEEGPGEKPSLVSNKKRM